MKKLGQRNLYYSIWLAVVMMLCLVGYFVLMLPSLYVDHMRDQNLEAVKKQHEAFVKTGTYEGVRVKNPMACVSVKIPFQGYKMELTSKLASVSITVEDPKIQELFREIQKIADGFDLKQFLSEEKSASWKSREKDERLSGLRKRMEAVKETIRETISADGAQLPVKAEIIQTAGFNQTSFTESFQIHAVSEHMVLLEAGASDENNQYTNYLAAERLADGIVFSVLPVVTPDMQEIRPVVLQSLPMLCAVILMLVLIFSQIYSAGIVLPVYQKLQDANQALLKENERQEVFLRASSHQLKTPVTAALLLLDGIIGEVGKYKDTKTYLPQVKKQLLSMREMIDKILSVNPCHAAPDLSSIVLYEFVQAVTEPYRIAAAEKNQKIVLEGDRKTAVFTDRERLFQILDNLLSNASAYTPQGGQICIHIEKKSVAIWNSGVTIPQDIMPYIFQPFMRGSHGTQSHGLGLYIADYYAERIGAQLLLRNERNGVQAVLKLPDRL